MVAVGNTPMAFFTDAAELAAAACWLGEPAPLLDEESPEELSPATLALLVVLLWLCVPTTAPTTTPMMTQMATGIPNLIQLLVRFFIGTGVMYPEASFDIIRVILASQ